MHAFWKRMFPEASIEWAMCREGKEDSPHLRFKCLPIRAMWARQKTLWVDVTSEEAFWGSHRGRGGGIYRRKAEEGMLFAVLLAIWLHHNTIVFKGRVASMDGLGHDLKGFVP